MKNFLIFSELYFLSAAEVDFHVDIEHTFVIPLGLDVWTNSLQFAHAPVHPFRIANYIAYTLE